jgi:hypothetical protein
MTTPPPSCLGYYGMQDRCKGCIWAEVCRGLISKDRLKPLVKTVLEMKDILRGG